MEKPRMRRGEGHKTDIGGGWTKLNGGNGNAERTKEKSKRGEASTDGKREKRGKETHISPLAKSSSHFIDGQEKERKMRGKCRRHSLLWLLRSCKPLEIGKANNKRSWDGKNGENIVGDEDEELATN